MDVQGARGESFLSLANGFYYLTSPHPERYPIQGSKWLPAQDHIGLMILALANGAVMHRVASYMLRVNSR